MTDKPNKKQDSAHLPRWPVRLQELFEQQRTGASKEVKCQLRDEMWLLLHTSLFYYLRSHNYRLGLRLEDELHDIATEKSLDLLERIHAGKWELTGLAPLMIVAYVSKVARNCLLGRQRKRKYEQSFQATEQQRDHEDVGRKAPATPLDQLERRDFACQLRLCAETLKPQSRLIWMMRVFGGLSTQQIANNPRVALQPGHIDVLLHRVRGQMRSCMDGKGFDTTVIPVGCFCEMLRSFDLALSLPELEADDEY